MNFVFWTSQLKVDTEENKFFRHLFLSPKLDVSVSTLYKTPSHSQTYKPWQENKVFRRRFFKTCLCNLFVYQPATSAM